MSRGGYMLGAPLAGALIGFVDPAWVLLMDAVSFVLSAALVGTLTRPVRERQDHATGEGYLRQLRDGARYLLKDRLILAIVLMVMATNALDAGIASVLLPVYAERVLHSPLALGALLSAFGAGALLGGVLYGWLGPRLPMWPLYTVAFFLTGAPRLLTLAVDPGVPWLVAVMLGTGIAAGTLNPLLAVAELRRVPEELRSRVYGVIVAASLAGTPVGVLMAGATADGLGVRWAFVVYGVVYLLVTLCPLVFPVWRRLGEPAKGAPARPRADAAAVAAD
nr:hypothetical protein GCM10020241_62720 [Streptoalloteichus tenebrarius]